MHSKSCLGTPWGSSHDHICRPSRTFADLSRTSADLRGPSRTFADLSQTFADLRGPSRTSGGPSRTFANLRGPLADLRAPLADEVRLMCVSGAFKVRLKCVWSAPGKGTRHHHHRHDINRVQALSLQGRYENTYIYIYYITPGGPPLTP